MRKRRLRDMPNITTKQDVVAYFTEKRDRSGEEGGEYHEAVVAILDVLNQTEDVAAIKATVRGLHRALLGEIQRIADAETRGRERKRLGVYDDCLTQLRGVRAHE